MNRELIVRKTKTIREWIEDPRMRTQMQLAIPRHLTVDRLLRTVVTAIRMNPGLLDCTKESILAAVMGCAQLGLEPEPFLGQAYLVPFKRKGVLEATLIPGYRGYIALARRSGEVQSVSAQVVYSNDHFILQYGTQEKLEHIPADGDRGIPRGAYVVFNYKDGSHSFDYMTKDDIEKIRDRSRAKENGPWVTDWPEMAKKTVIRRHAKLAPLAVEIQRAAALEDRAYGGESQFDMIFPESEQAPKQLGGKTFWIAVDDYCQETNRPLPDKKKLETFIEATAQGNEMSPEAIMEAAAVNIEGFLKQYDTWVMNQAESKETERILPFAKLKKTGLMEWEKEHRDKLPKMPQEVQKAFMEKWERVMGTEYSQWLAETHGPHAIPPEEQEPEPKTQTAGDGTDEEVTCPNTQERMKKSYCNSYCKQREGCPVFG